MRTLLSLDLGTSQLKMSLISENGDVLYYNSYGYLQDSYSSNKKQAQIWISTVKQALSLIPQGHIQKIYALSIGGQAPSLVALDKNKEVLDVLLWSDFRNFSIGQSYYLPHVIWLIRNKPEIYERTVHFVGAYEYIAWSLGADLITILPSQDYLPYFWPQELLTEYKLDPKLFPPFVSPGKIIGLTTQKSIPAVPIIAGGMDFLMNFLGTGAIKPHTLCDRTGTSEGLNYVGASPLASVKTPFKKLPHLTPKLKTAYYSLSGSGQALQWFFNLKTDLSEISYPSLFEHFIPLSSTLSTPFFYPCASLKAYHFENAQFVALNSTHHYYHLLCAVAESIAFYLKYALSELQKQGSSWSIIKVTGEQSTNIFWNQLKANILGYPLETYVMPYTELVGQAIIGFKTLGITHSWEEGYQLLARKKVLIEPDSKLYGFYQEKFYLWKTYYQNT